MDIKQYIREIMAVEIERSGEGVEASIVDAESQHLSKGVALLHLAEQTAGFWPRDSADLDKLQRCAAFLTTADGRRFRIRDFHRCTSFVLHYDFAIEKVDA